MTSLILNLLEFTVFNVSEIVSTGEICILTVMRIPCYIVNGTYLQYFYVYLLTMGIAFLLCAYLCVVQQPCPVKQPSLEDDVRGVDGGLLARHSDTVIHHGTGSFYLRLGAVGMVQLNVTSRDY